MTGLDADALLKVALAVLCGGAIGIEREVRGRAAGLRTMILVCLGSTLTMIVSNHLVAGADGVQEAIVRIDPSRIAAGIVTGIGFLGGAVVVKLGDLVRGVTTAASIWLAASLGIVIGQGFYLLALIGVLVALAVLTAFDRIDRALPQPVYRTATLAVARGRAERAEREARAAFADVRGRVMDLQAASDASTNTMRLVFQVRVDRSVDVRSLIEKLDAIDGCQYASWTPLG